MQAAELPRQSMACRSWGAVRDPFAPIWVLHLQKQNEPVHIPAKVAPARSNYRKKRNAMSDYLKQLKANAAAHMPSSNELMFLSRAVLSLTHRMDKLVSDCDNEEDVIAGLATSGVWVAGAGVDENPVVNWVHHVMPGMFDDVNTDSRGSNPSIIELCFGKAVITINTPYFLSEVIRYWPERGLAGLVDDPMDYGFEALEDNTWGAVPTPKAA